MAYTYRHGDRPLDGVTVQRAVGRGGFGEVYYALTDSGKQVALKYLRENPEIELRGISHVLNLKSPHLITIYDVKQNEHGEPFVIMEYVSGPSLRELLLAEPDGLGEQKAAFFLANIGKGLGYLHDRGIVHRDMKPGNIFYDDGYVKIGDYGLSKHISVSRHSNQTVSIGTVHYMAPEIGTGTYTKAIDIYAVGVILYEMLMGRLPFTGSSMGEVLMRHLRDEPNLAGVPDSFVPVIRKALAKDPADRYQDIHEMVDAVMSVTEVHQSVASFNPATLTAVPRVPSATDDATVTTPPARRAPAPELDVRVGLDPPPLPDENDPAPPQAAQLRRVLSDRRNTPHTRADAQPGAAPPTRITRAQRAAQLSTAFALSLAVAAGASLWQSFERGDPVAFGVVSWLYVAGATFGMLIAHFTVIGRAPIRNPLTDRIVYGGAAIVGMLPGAVLAGPVLARMAIVLIGLFILFSMHKRIVAARRHHFSGGDLFWIGVVGWLAGRIFDVDDGALVTGLLAAGTVLCVQTAAAAWPLPRRHQGKAPPRESPGRKKSEEWYGGRWWEPGAWKADQRLEERAAEGAPPAHTATAEPAASGAAMRSRSAAWLAAVARFVGLSLVLVMLALLLAAPAIEVQDPRTDVRPGPVLSIMGLGLLLLIGGRAYRGGLHLWRGVLGSLLALVAAVLVAFGPAAEAVRALVVNRGHNALPLDQELVLALSFTALALLLLLWPRRRRHTIVI